MPVAPGGGGGGGEPTYQFVINFHILSLSQFGSHLNEKSL